MNTSNTPASPRIYIAGLRGMVGSAIVRQLQGGTVIASEARQSMTPEPPGLPRPGGLAMTNEQPIVRIDPRYFRPTEVETLLGDPTKAKQKLGWVPEITAQEMCAEMVAHDLAQAKQHALLKANGYQVNVSVE